MVCSVELRTPVGVREPARGAVIAFPPGPAGAHRVRDVSGAPARHPIVSTMLYPELAEHPNTGTILAMKGPGGGRASPSGSAHGHRALTREALEADRGR